MMGVFNGSEELKNNTDLINIFNSRNKYGTNMWTFGKIIRHRKIRENNQEVKLIWFTGEAILNPMKIIHYYEKLTLATSARDNGIINMKEENRQGNSPKIIRSPPICPKYLMPRLIYMQSNTSMDSRCDIVSRNIPSCNKNFNTLGHAATSR